MSIKKLLSAFFLILTVQAYFFAATVYKNNVTASYYAEAFHGKKTSNGERFNMYALTCAHKTLPFNTILKVTNLRNGKSVQVRVNDRGPFVSGREIDLSKAAAVKLGMIGTGTTKVRLEIIKKGLATKASVTTAKKAQEMMHKIEAKNSGSGSKKTTNTHTKPTNVKRALGSRWDVQLGAFSSKANANKLAQKLLQAGFNGVVFVTNTSTGVTKVVIKDVDASDLYKVESKLIKAGFKEYTINSRKK